MVTVGGFVDVVGRSPRTTTVVRQENKSRSVTVYVTAVSGPASIATRDSIENCDK